MEKHAESKRTIKVLPGDELALALALPRVPVEVVRQSLLTSLPFLGLDRHGLRSVWGTVSGVGLSMAMPWPGPRGFSWRAHPQAVAPEAPLATHLSKKPFYTNQASTAGFPAIGLMISGTGRPQPGTGNASSDSGRLSTQQLSPTLFGLLSQKESRVSTNETTQKRMPDDASTSFSWPAPRSDRRHAPTGIRPRELATTFSSSQPANNTGRDLVHAGPGTIAIYRSENTPTMKGSIVNRIAGSLSSVSNERFSVPTTPSERRHRPSEARPRELAMTPSSESLGSEPNRLASAPIGPMNSILRLLPALRLNTPIKPDLLPSGSRRVPAGNYALQRDGFDARFHKAGARKVWSASRAVSAGLPRLGSSSTYATVRAGDANKQERRVLPEPEVHMTQREVAFRRGLTVVADAVEVLVQCQVKAAVERQVDATMSQVSSAGPSSGGIKAADFASDEIARALMQKMRDLAQEDRFRCGKLR